jgi:gas vesicle protein
MMSFSSYEPSVQIAIISLISTVIGTLLAGIFTVIKNKVDEKKAAIEAKKSDIAALESLTEIALKMNKQEFQMTRDLNKSLMNRIKDLEEDISRKDTYIQDLEKRLEVKKSPEDKSTPIDYSNRE